MQGTSESLRTFSIWTGPLVMGLSLSLWSGFSPLFGADPSADPITTSPPGTDAHVAKVIVDWKNRLVRLEASLPGAAAGKIFQIKVSKARLGDEKLPTVQVAESKVIIGGSTRALLAAMAPDTRSLWIEDAAKSRSRVDLPIPIFKGISSKPAEVPEGGLVVTLATDGLLPGFVLSGAKGEDGALGKSRPIQASPGNSSRLLSVTSQDDVSKIDVWLPPLPPGTEKMAYSFTLVNPDGSQSETLALFRIDNHFEERAKTTLLARPAAVDEPVQVPSLELLTVGEALDLAQKAGLLPVLIDSAEGEEVPAAGKEKELVLHQGLEPDSKVHKGDIVLLSVHDPRALGRSYALFAGTIAGTASKATSEGGVPRPDPTVIDTRDELGFVDLGKSAGFSGLNAGKATEHGSGSEEGTGISEETLADDSSAGINDVLPINPDPGIPIDPTRGNDEAVEAAVLKVVLQAMAGTTSIKDLPGPLGKTISEAVQTEEKNLLAALAKGNSVERVPADRILDLALHHLQLHLSNSDRQLALVGWRDFARPRLHPVLLDRNHNHLVADDVAIWFVIWLYQHGHYNPARDVQITQGSSGTPVAVTGDTRPPADWIKKKPPPIKLGKGFVNRPGPGSGDNHPGGFANKPKPPGQAALSVTDETIVIPVGPAEVKEVSTPDKVRIPPVKGTNARTAQERLRQVGLDVAPTGTILGSDLVEASKPEEGKDWVKPGTGVELVVKRKVPMVEEMTFKDALATLEKLKLQGKPAHADSRPTDIVDQQKPGPGEFIRPGDAVDLVLVREVPAVNKEALAKAEKILRERGFRPVSTPLALETDTIADQKPEAGKKVAIGIPVHLTVRRVVPDVAEKTLADARKILKEQHLEMGLAKEPPQIEDLRVIDQKPKAGKGFVIPANITKTDLLQVTVTPGSKVPEAQGMILANARAKVEGAGLEFSAYIMDGKPIPIPKAREGGLARYKVVKQDPPVNTRVALGTQVACILEPPPPHLKR